MAAKVAIDAELAYVQDRLKTGQATAQTVSMKAIKWSIGKKFQARVKPIDMDHVRTIASLRDSGIDLGRIVVFRSITTGEMAVADGHHRAEEADVRGDDSIPAYVVDTDDMDTEGVLYATMCNRKSILIPTLEDRRNAAFMLFGSPGWHEATATRLCAHLGANRATVAKWRAAYSLEKGIPVPEFLKTETGTIVRSRHRSGINRGDAAPSVSGNGIAGYRAKVSGKSYYLGLDETSAKEKAVEIKRTLSESHSARRRSLTNTPITSFLSGCGFVFRGFGYNGSNSSVSGYVGHGVAFTVSLLAGEETVATVVGRVLLLREREIPSGRAVVICYREGGRQDEIKVAERLGVEFLTPEEFVDSLRVADAG